MAWRMMHAPGGGDRSVFGATVRRIPSALLWLCGKAALLWLCGKAALRWLCGKATALRWLCGKATALLWLCGKATALLWLCGKKATALLLCGKKATALLLCGKADLLFDEGYDPVEPRFVGRKHVAFTMFVEYRVLKPGGKTPARGRWYHGVCFAQDMQTPTGA